MVPDGEFDPERPIDVDGVCKDLEEIIRQGFSTFLVTKLQELRYFLSCFSIGRTDIVSLESAELSAQVIRGNLTRFIHEIPETLVRQSVAKAIFGLDSETAGLGLEVRQTLAGKRYSPAKPVGFHTIRKKPYGQQWKLVTYLSDRFVKTEKVARLQVFADYSEWGMETPLPEGASVVVMTEEGPSTVGGVVRKTENAPALPSDSELEAVLGYRWLEYERSLVCSHNLSTLTLTTKVLIQIKSRGTRVFVHRFPTWVNMGFTLPAPSVTVNTQQSYAPVAYIGRVCYSAKYQNWWLDYFDFGPGEHDDQFYLTFDHVYDNPERQVPSELAAIPEFDEIRSFLLTGYRLLEDGETKEDFKSVYHKVSPVRGKQHVCLLQTSPDLVRYQLKDLADWHHFKELQQQRTELNEFANEINYEMRDLLKIVEPTSDELDKNGK